MKKFSLTTAIAVFLLICAKWGQAQTTQAQPSTVAIGIRDVINSKVLNEQRRLLIYVPASATSEVYTKQRYPVIFLLDGEADHFSYVAGMVRQLSSVYVCPEMIVVGIPNTDRTRDLTPTHMDSWKFLNLELGVDLMKNSGGGEKFISFLKKELIPHIDSLYPTMPYRILFGHSFGGLTAINTLLHHTNLFKTFVVVDPAMSWDNQRLLNEAKEALADTTYDGITVFLGIANTMNPGMDTIKVKKDFNNETEHIRSCFELRDYLTSNSQNKLNFTFKYYGNDNHNSVLPVAEYDGLRFIFNYLHFNWFDLNNYRDIENQYELLSRHFGFEVKPPENLVNNLAYAYLSLNMHDIAFNLFKLNISNYPESYNVYNSMGDFYSANGDKSKTIVNYTKALTIKEVPAVRKKLESLLGKK